MQTYAKNGRPLPNITPIARPYFEAARAGRLELQDCPRDGFFFYPRSHCPHCLRTDWSWRPARDTGRLHAFTIERMGQDPGLRAQVPFIIAIVDLDDGPRAIGNVVKTGLGDLRIGMKMRIGFECIEDSALMVFHPLDERVAA